MFRRIKSKLPSKSKKPVSESHAQGTESQSSVPLQIAATGFDIPQDGVLTVARQDLLPPGAVAPADAKRTRDLWEEAFTKLDDEKKDLLSKIEEPQGPKVVERVAEQTEKSYREHEARGWKVSRGKGKPDINLRAVFKKALTSILKFKQLISAGIAYEPTGHAAAAWTIISLGLQMTQNDADMRKKVFETCEMLAENLTLLAAIEASHRGRTVQNSENLEDSIIIVYVAILELSAEVVRENTLNVGQRILKSFTALAVQPLNDFIKIRESRKAALRQWTEIIEHQYRAKEAEDLREKVATTLAGIEQSVFNIASKILTAEEQSILDWLSKYSFSDSHVAAASRREPGTGAWILSLPTYEAWKTTNNNVLWLYGNSGCGKSILCSSIIDDLENLCSPNSTASGYALVYWYFTFSIRDSVVFDNLLSSIIRQLCAETQTLPQELRGLWTKHRMAGSRPTRSGLIETLDMVIFGLKSVDQHALVVLDALDEYPLTAEQDSSGTQQTSDRGDVLHWLEQLCTKHSNVHVLVLSRDETDIRSKMRNVMKVDIAKYVAGDLNVFIQKSIDRIVQERPWKRSYESQLLSRFEENSERRFRWASLVLRRFGDCKTPERLQEALKDLPDTLEAMYADVLVNKIPKDYMEQARLMLIWLSYSLRPLTLQELACVAFLPEPRDVLDICTSSLVSMRRKEGRSRWSTNRYEESELREVVQLDHFSVKEYLTSTHLLASKETTFFYASPLVAHLTIAEVSVSRLLKTNEVDLVVEGFFLARQKTRAISLADPLLDYSISWFRHTQEADAIEKGAPESKDLRSEDQAVVIQSDLEVLRSQSHRLFRKEYIQSYQNWVQIVRISRDHFWIPSYGLSDYRSPMAFASFLGLHDNVRRMLESGANVDGHLDKGLDDRWGTRFGTRKPVEIAAELGNLEILRLLLENNASLTQSELNEIARFNKRFGAAVLTSILEARPDLAVTNRIVISSAENSYSLEMLEYILKTPSLYRPTENVLIDITKRLFTFFSFHALQTGIADSLVKTILDLGDDIGCNNDRMLEAFLQSACGDSIKRVLDRYQPPSETSIRVLESVAENEKGQLMLPVVVEYYNGLGVDVEFSENMLVKAASNKWSGQKLFWAILNLAQTVLITENVMKSIATNFVCGIDTMSTIMDHASCDVKNFEGVGVNDARSHMEKHMRTCPIEVPEEIMEAAARWKPAAIEYLQSHARPNVTFTRSTAEQASSDWDVSFFGSDEDARHKRRYFNFETDFI